MARTIGSVILGYLVMVIVVFATFSLAYQAMGVDRAYQPGTYDVSGLWIAVSIVLGILAAILGDSPVSVSPIARPHPRHWPPSC